MRRALIAMPAVLLACVAATPAHGATAITQDRIVVTTSAGRAVIRPEPFRISFQDRSGRTLLREVHNREPAGRPLPLTRDPEPFALEREPDNASYSPLGFELGRERRAQWNAGFWNGDMLFSRRYGSAHFAHRVLNAIPIRGGVRLEVSTSSRRRLLVRVVADVEGSIRVRARLRNGPGVISMADSFVAAPGEGYYGFGGRHGTVNKRGEKLYGWTEQESFGGEQTLRGGLALLPTLIRDGSDYTLEQLGTEVDVPDGIPGGYERYLAPTGPNGAYYPQALFVSSRGFGFMLNQPEYSRWRMGNDRRGAWQVQVSARTLDYTVALGPTPARLRPHAHGHQRPPPAPARLGSGTDARARRRGSGAARAARARDPRHLPGQDRAGPRRHGPLRREAERLRVRGLGAPRHGLRARADPAPAGARRALGGLPPGLRLGRRALDTGPRRLPGDLQLRVRRHVAGGESRTCSARTAAAPATLLDFKRRATLRWWRARLELLLDAGADGFMQDFGEQVQDGMRFADGSTGRTMHNRYPVIFNRASRRIADAWARRNPERGTSRGSSRVPATAAGRAAPPTRWAPSRATRPPTGARARACARSDRTC